MLWAGDCREPATAALPAGGGLGAFSPVAAAALLPLDTTRPGRTGRGLLRARPSRGLSGRAWAEASGAEKGPGEWPHPDVRTLCGGGSGQDRGAGASAGAGPEIRGFQEGWSGQRAEAGPAFSWARVRGICCVSRSERVWRMPGASGLCRSRKLDLRSPEKPCGACSRPAPSVGRGRALRSWP